MAIALSKAKIALSKSKAIALSQNDRTFKNQSARNFKV
jgi:hypothetical protein